MSVNAIQVLAWDNQRFNIFNVIMLMLFNVSYNNSGIKPGFTKINLTTPNESHNTDEV